MRWDRRLTLEQPKERGPRHSQRASELQHGEPASTAGAAPLAGEGLRGGSADPKDAGGRLDGQGLRAG